MMSMCYVSTKVTWPVSCGRLRTPGSRLCVSTGASLVRRSAWAGSNDPTSLTPAPGCGSAANSSTSRSLSSTTPRDMAVNLKTIPFDQRGHRDRETRLLAIAQGLNAAAEIGLEEHDRLAPTRLMIERKLDGRPTSSKLPERVMAKPLVSAGVVEKALGVTPPGGAADCGEARLAGDDGEGEVSGSVEKRPLASGMPDQPVRASQSPIVFP